MTAQPKKIYMPLAKLTSATYKRKNLRPKMRETQTVLVKFSSKENCLQIKNVKDNIKFADTTFIQTETNLKKFQVYIGKSIKIASEKWNAPCLIKTKPFGGFLPTHGFYYAAEKFIAIRNKAENEFLDKSS